ncbi:MAG: hypothetical protein KDL87_16265, partial [Verrucomicrobiae bacterium]|nr:hypothetical protein [Verrucomicrobiae bacterium]
MSSHPGRSLIASAERRFGHLAIPHLIRWIGVFQFTVWGLALISPGFEDHLLLDQTKVYQGEIWRILTFVFVPRTSSPILILFAVFFLWFISDGIEQEWGPFRVNLYVLSTIACLVAVGLIPVFGIVVNVATAFLFFSAMYFAFAAIYPNQIINLFGVIPVKAKWLAFGNLGYLIYIVMQLPLFLLAVIAGLLVLYRDAFYRGGDWRRFRPTPGWLALVLVTLVALTLVGFLAFRHVEYREDLWWDFAWHGDAPRFLRVTLVLAVVAAALALDALLRRPAPLPAASEPIPDAVRRLLDACPDTQPQLALLGDKRFLVSDDGDAFLMYAVA